MPSDHLSETSLVLVEEVRLHKLLEGYKGRDRLEASGVVIKDGAFYVVFDNLQQIGSIPRDISLRNQGVLFRTRGHNFGFEDITYNRRAQRFYVIIEGRKQDRHRYQPEIIEYDEAFHQVDKHTLPLELDRKNKGVEGIACLERDAVDYLLALCEGNLCRGGQEGEQRGGGRIQVFRKHLDRWEYVQEIQIPASVQFEDYAAIAVADNRVAIVSQQTSALWVGRLHESAWAFVDRGVTYGFPKNARGKTIYCNIEGVDWINEQLIVVVSDAKKDEDARACSKKAQSLHIFRRPTG